MKLTGGRLNSDGSTSAIVTYLEPGGNADKSGVCLGKTTISTGVGGRFYLHNTLPE